jgi:hypothetical protein
MRFRITTATTIVHMGEADGYQQHGANCFDEECILLCEAGGIPVINY